MKGLKKTSILLAAFLTASAAFSLTACTDPESGLKEGKTNITFYARHFEDWSDDFTKKMEIGRASCRERVYRLV